MVKIFLGDKNSEKEIRERLIDFIETTLMCDCMISTREQLEGDVLKELKECVSFDEIEESVTLDAGKLCDMLINYDLLGCFDCYSMNSGVNYDMFFNGLLIRHIHEEQKNKQ